MRIVYGSEKEQKNVPEKEKSTAEAHNNVLLENHKLFNQGMGDKMKMGKGDWVLTVFTARESVLSFGPLN